MGFGTRNEYADDGTTLLGQFGDIYCDGCGGPASGDSVAMVGVQWDDGTVNDFVTVKIACSPDCPKYSFVLELCRAGKFKPASALAGYSTKTVAEYLDDLVEWASNSDDDSEERDD